VTRVQRLSSKLVTLAASSAPHVCVCAKPYISEVSYRKHLNSTDALIPPRRLCTSWNWNSKGCSRSKFAYTRLLLKSLQIHRKNSSHASHSMCYPVASNNRDTMPTLITHTQKSHIFEFRSVHGHSMVP